MTEEFLNLMALATLGVASVGFLAGFLWAIPAAYRDRREVDPDERGMAIFASYQLLVSVLSTFSLLCFVVTALLILLFDMDAIPRVLGARLLVFAVVCAITVLVVGGPVARKRANRGEVARVREKEREREERARLQETANETNERVKAMLEFAAGVRQRLEEHDARTQSDRDQVKDDLKTQQAKVRDALGEEQDTVRDRLDEHDTRSDTRQDKSDAEAEEERIAARMNRVEETQARQERKQDSDLRISQNIEKKLDGVAEEQDTVREKKEERE